MSHQLPRILASGLTTTVYLPVGSGPLLACEIA